YAPRPAEVFAFGGPHTDPHGAARAHHGRDPVLTGAAGPHIAARPVAERREPMDGPERAQSFPVWRDGVPNRLVGVAQQAQLLPADADRLQHFLAPVAAADVEHAGAGGHVMAAKGLAEKLEGDVL